MMNKIRPNTIPKINESQIGYKWIENIGNYIRACKEDLKLAPTDLFDIPDLYDEKDLNAVILHIHVIAKFAQNKLPNFIGPFMPKEDRDETKNGKSFLFESSSLVRKKSVELPQKIEELHLTIPVLNGIEIGQSIGSGQFGNVYLGKWESLPVALKACKSDDVDEISQELSVLMDLRHPHVLILYGIYVNNQQSLMVTEFMNEGDLLNFLRNEQDTPQLQLIRFAQQTCQAMKYLHHQNVLHRDLACRNLLVSRENSTITLKISDFGFSRKTEDYYSSEKNGVFPVRWSAIEVIDFRKYTKASDVWSYGIVLWEIFSLGRIPYSGFTNSQVVDKVRSGVRLQAPLLAPSEIGEFMLKCWSKTPSERPNFEDILKLFEKFFPEDRLGLNLPSSPIGSPRLTSRTNSSAASRNSSNEQIKSEEKDPSGDLEASLTENTLDSILFSSSEGEYSFSPSMKSTASPQGFYSIEEPIYHQSFCEDVISNSQSPATSNNNSNNDLSSDIKNNSDISNPENQNERMCQFYQSEISRLQRAHKEEIDRLKKEIASLRQELAKRQ